MLVAVEPVEYNRIVIGGNSKGFLCKPAAFFQRSDGTPLIQDVCQRLVLLFACYDDNVVVVLGSGADERDASDVDLLDDVFIGGARGYRLLKGVEVYHHEVDVGDVVAEHLCLIRLVVAASEDASEYFRVERLHASAQDGWVACEVFNFLAGKAQRYNEVVRATRGEQFHAFFVEAGYYLVKPVFMEDGDKGCFYSFVI